MNTKKSVLLATVATLCVLAAPMAMAGGRGHSSASFSGQRASFSGQRAGFSGRHANFSASRSGFNATRSSFAAQRASFNPQRQTQFSQRSGTMGNWRGSGNHGNWRGSGNHHRHHGRHHHRFNNIIFADFGFPYWYGYGWGYPYYGYGYYPYDDEYYSYDEGYYSDNGGVYEGRLDTSLVVQVQRRLARAGYYHGAIDGVIGGGTRSAIRAYERSHRLPVDGRIDGQLLARLGRS
jgi:putative peptidoglycan binding protein